MWPTFIQVKLSCLARLADRLLRSGWNHLAGGGLLPHEIDGTHTSILQEPNVCALADKLSDCFDDPADNVKD
jgi:hypothetical protein